MEKINRILLLATLIGVLLLLFLSMKLEPQKIPINNITTASLDRQVKIEGNIIKTRDYNNDTFHVLTFNDSSGKIEVIFNSKQERRLSINSSLNYSAYGKVSKYNETLQITADKIVLSS
jgi:uncharacterized protein YdeI (BOF family)